MVCNGCQVNFALYNLHDAWHDAWVCWAIPPTHFKKEARAIWGCICAFLTEILREEKTPHM